MTPRERAEKALPCICTGREDGLFEGHIPECNARCVPAVAAAIAAAVAEGTAALRLELETVKDANGVMARNLQHMHLAVAAARAEVIEAMMPLAGDAVVMTKIRQHAREKGWL